MFQIQSPMMMSQQNQVQYHPFQGAGPMPAPSPNPMGPGGQQQQQNPMMAKLQQMGMQKLMGGMPGANPMGPQASPGTSANPINWNDGSQQSGGIDWNNQRPPMPAGADGTPAFPQQNFFPAWLTGMFQR